MVCKEKIGSRMKADSLSGYQQPTDKVSKWHIIHPFGNPKAMEFQADDKCRVKGDSEVLYGAELLLSDH